MRVGGEKFVCDSTAFVVNIVLISNNFITTTHLDAFLQKEKGRNEIKLLYNKTINQAQLYSNIL